MPELVDDGWCFACGKLNPYGLHLVFKPTESGARATFIAERHHQGYQGIAHGGIVFTLLDESIAYAIAYKYGLGATGEFNARIRRPCPVGVPLTVEAWVIRQRQRLVEAQSRLTDPEGRLIAEASAKFMLSPEGTSLPASHRLDADAII